MMLFTPGSVDWHRPQMLTAAKREGRMIATLDADFHALLALSQVSGPSVVRIRIEGLRGLALAILLETVWQRCEDDLAKGALVTVTERHIRVHQLPVGGGR